MYLMSAILSCVNVSDISLRIPFVKVCPHVTTIRGCRVAAMLWRSFLFWSLVCLLITIVVKCNRPRQSFPIHICVCTCIRTCKSYQLCMYRSTVYVSRIMCVWVSLFFYYLVSFVMWYPSLIASQSTLMLQFMINFTVGIAKTHAEQVKMIFPWF